MFVLGNLINAVATLLDMVLTFAMWVIIARAVLSWVSPDPYNPIVSFIYSVTEPIFRPLQRFMPPMGGMDLTPMVALFIIIFLQSFLVRTLHDIAMRAG